MSDKKESMKLFGATTWIWWCMMMVFIMPSILAIVEDECGQQLGYSTVSFNPYTGEKCYSKFLKRLRNLVEAPVRACGLPSTRSTPLPGAEYVTVDLKISNTQWVTLGIDAKDLYVWGFQDKYNGKYRANFVKDVPLAAKNSLFQDATTNRTTRFKGNYIELEKYADKDKKEQILALESLGQNIKNVYGKPESQLNNAVEATFYLIAIQMVAEAARFKFIEDAIVAKDNSPNTKLKLVGFLNDWAKISNAIHRAENQSIKCTTVTPPIVVGNIEYKKMVNTVDDIKSDMGLLKYMNAPSSNLDSGLDVGRAFPKSAVM